MRHAILYLLALGGLSGCSSDMPKRFSTTSGPEERYAVVLTEVITEPDEVVSALRSHREMSYAEARRYIARVPVTVAEGLTRRDAERLHVDLEFTGAEASILPEGTISSHSRRAE